MPLNGATQRPNITSRIMSKLTSGESSGGPNRSDSRRVEFKLVSPFNIPSSPESAAIRITKNLSHFALYYTHFVWIILFITLIPERKVSLILLVIMTYVASVYFLLLQALPKSNILAKVLDKRLVLPAVVLATMIELILTGAGLHLVFTLVGALPVVLVHAVLWVREDCPVEEAEAGGVSGEFLPLVNDESTVDIMA